MKNHVDTLEVTPQRSRIGEIQPPMLHAGRPGRQRRVRVTAQTSAPGTGARQRSKCEPTNPDAPRTSYLPAGSRMLPMQRPSARSANS